MASLTASGPQLLLDMQAIRTEYPNYCASQTVPVLDSLLQRLGDHPLKEEVKASYNRLVDKQIPGLPHAAHAALLFCVFETIADDAQVTPHLINRFHRLLTGLEACFNILPPHCSSNNVLYNHIYGMFAGCIITDEAVILADIARIFRNSAANDEVLRGFQGRMEVSTVVNQCSETVPFRNAVRDEVGTFLGKAPEAQPHQLISVMIAVEQWAAHVHVASHMAKYSVHVDCDPAKVQLYSQCASGSVTERAAQIQAATPTQTARFGKHAQMLPFAPNSITNQNGQLPPMVTAPAHQQSQQDQRHGSPSQPRAFQPRRTASLAQQRGQGQSLTDRSQGLPGAPPTDYAADSHRRASAPTPHLFGSASSHLDPPSTACPAFDDLFRTTPEATPSQHQFPQFPTMTAQSQSGNTFPNIFGTAQTQPAGNNQSSNSQQQQPTRNQQLNPPPTQLQTTQPFPSTPTHQSTGQRPTRTSSRRRTGVQNYGEIQYEEDSDEVDENGKKTGAGLLFRGEDPNDEDRTGL